MSNKELLERAKKAMPHLVAVNPTWYETEAYNCLRMFCERIEQTKNLVETFQKLEMYVVESELRKQTSVLITNKQALDIVKYVPLYKD